MDESSRGLLAPDEKEPRRSYDRRSSFDNRRRSSEESDLDATEFLSADPLPERALESRPKPAFLHGQRQSRLATWHRPFTHRSRCCLILIGVAILVWLLLGAGGTFAYKKYTASPPTGQSPPWYPTPKGGSVSQWADSYDKAAKMVKKMTLSEKVNITTGTGWSMGLAVGTTGPAVHVGFPQLQLQDGPLGIRFADNATAWPAGITTAATWNRGLMYARGKGHGQEAHQKGINAILGPCVGPLGRMPAGGRNWEGFGPDPYLAGVAAAETIKGIQSEGVMATIKHFVGNEQEHFRQSWEWGLPNAMSSNIDDRALHELYAWPFADAIKAGVVSVMCSYNMVNNSYACDNSKLMNGILKDELGFQGFVMSDWLAQRSGVASALSGLDMTMPGDGLRWQDGKSLWGGQLSRAILNGSVPIDRLNDMVTRIVASWYQMGQDDEKKWPRELPNFSSWTDEKMGVLAPGSPTEQEEFEVNKYVNVQGNHSAIARQVAAEGIVMLKNERLLPLGRDGHSVSRKEDHGKIRIGIFGEDAGPGKGPNFCKDRGCNQGTLGSGWGSGAAEFPHLIPPVDALKGGFNKDKVQLAEYLTNAPPFNKQPEILRDQDVCIVFANSDSGEGYIGWGTINGDRNDLFLQKGTDDLIVQVANECGGGTGQTLVVVHSVGPVIMERWIELPGVKAVLYANLPGEESGNALADVVFGNVNPSGHLPYVIGKRLQDYGAAGQVMYMPNGVVPQQDFSEGLFIDQKHFDKHEIEPRFPLGFGLGFADFEFANVSVTTVKEKSTLPAPRPEPGATPPDYGDRLPDEREALWPSGFRRYEKYIYPYLDSADDIVADPYPYPDGYNEARTPSAAGGGEGGNPDLWETYVRVSADVRNVGNVGGKAVPQLYLSYPDTSAGVEFPRRVLRGFEKVFVEAGESATVEFEVTRRDLSYWDVGRQNWVMLTEGEYTFGVGANARDVDAFVKW